jgi:hypothetical protein
LSEDIDSEACFEAVNLVSRYSEQSSIIPVTKNVSPINALQQNSSDSESGFSLKETESIIENINKNISKICSDTNFRSCWEARESVQAIIDLLVRSADIGSTLEELKARGLDYLAKQIPDSDLKNLFFRRIDPRCLGKHPKCEFFFK